MPGATWAALPLLLTSLALAQSPPVSTSTVKLHAAAKAIGKTYLGSATDNPELTDKPYVAILSDNEMFGQITPGNSMKWDATEPAPGNFTFDAADVIANLAKQNGQLLRGMQGFLSPGHNCVWQNQLPSWLENGTFDNTTLLDIVSTHCTTLVSRYKGQVHVLIQTSLTVLSVLLAVRNFYFWDVINEPFEENGTFRADVFFRSSGQAFIPTALRAARAADPDAKLYINDFNTEFRGPKLNATLDLVKNLLADGVPLDGIGFQGHLIVGQFPAEWADIMSDFTAMGLEVAITELDIRMTLPVTDALLEQQKKDYNSAIAACVSVENCVGVTLWDYTDKFSWVPSTFTGAGAACAFDENLVQKPAFDGIADALASGVQKMPNIAAPTNTPTTGGQGQGNKIDSSGTSIFQSSTTIIGIALIQSWLL